MSDQQKASVFKWIPLIGAVISIIIATGSLFVWPYRIEATEKEIAAIRIEFAAKELSSRLDHDKLIEIFVIVKDLQMRVRELQERKPWQEK